MVTKIYNIKGKVSREQSFTGKARLEQRPIGSEGAGPAAMGDKAFPVEGTTKILGQESARLLSKRIPRRPV